MTNTTSADSTPAATSRGAGTHQGSRPSAARTRLLETADRLFYQHGIRAVGVDRVVAESKVTRVTFYRHFPSKDALVVAYLHGRWDRDRSQLAALRANAPGDPHAVLVRLAEALLADIDAAGFRGCPYLNAVAEFDLAAHPARAVCAGHRRWLRAEITDLLTEADHPQADLVAEQLVMLRAGAMAVSAAAEGDGTAQAFLEAWHRLVALTGSSAQHSGEGGA